MPSQSPSLPFDSVQACLHGREYVDFGQQANMWFYTYSRMLCPQRVNREVLQTEFRKLRRKRAAAGYESRKVMAHVSENPSERSVLPALNRTKFSVRFCGPSHTFRSAAQRWTRCLCLAVFQSQVSRRSG